MKAVFCSGGCGREFPNLPDDATNVICVECDMKAERERAAKRFKSAACEGEPCNMCGSPAEHKVAEEIQFDDPNPTRHGFTAYVCHECFAEIMGSVVA